VTWIGRVLGGYRIESEIGRGGMSRVYRAYQSQLERWVAIKVLTTSAADKQAFLDAFRREAKAIAALRHPNIVTVYDYGEQEETAYIVMEFIPGGALSDVMQGTPMSWPEAAILIIPIARALAYAHSQGVIHCDVKPSNILLQQANWPLLADFGLLKILGSKIMDPGVMSGTPAYISPEQATGDSITSQSDIYSLGIVLYELLAGRLPFRGDSPSQLILQRLLEPPPPPSLYSQQISPHLEQVIMRMMARHSADRYSDMQAVVEALVRIPGASTLDSVTLAVPGSTTASLSGTKTLDAHSNFLGDHLIVPGTEAILPLPKKAEVVLGRADSRASKQPDIDLEPHGAIEAGVSRLHARLIYTDQGWMVEDLDSTNGTSVNMHPIAPRKPVRVRSGDVIRCGRLPLVFHEA
jgi:serine/threonine protein kinase